MSKAPIFATTALFCWLAAIILPASADPSAEQAIDTRGDLMKDMGKHMKALKKALGDGDTRSVAEHAKGLAMLTKTLATDLKSLFPAGSDQGDTSAKPLIWKQWRQFDQAAQSAATRGAALLDASNHAADVPSAYATLGDACKTCHKDYRAEK